MITRDVERSTHVELDIAVVWRNEPLDVDDEKIEVLLDLGQRTSIQQQPQRA